MSYLRHLALLLPLLALPALPLMAQDTRTVTEPSIPAACSEVTAQLASRSGALNPSDESKPDTARIQAMLDACAPGRSVVLRADAAHNAFLSGPLQLRKGVTLVVDDMA
jgi:polygalacturonase